MLAGFTTAAAAAAAVSAAAVVAPRCVRPALECFVRAANKTGKEKKPNEDESVREQPGEHESRILFVSLLLYYFLCCRFPACPSPDTASKRTKQPASTVAKLL